MPARPAVLAVRSAVRLAGIALGTAALSPSFAVAQPSTSPLARAVGGLEARELGPAIMGGRVADLDVVESDPATWYVGLASGGVWKTTSHGMSWTPLFDDQPCSSIGDVTLDQANPNLIWVGTGEPQNRQSSPYGCGVFRSLDGGDTWGAMGLEDTRHISRIRIHPRDPDLVYVAAVGHLWGPNEERGVFRTTDGGETWEKVLYVDENTGVIDLVMDPGDPRTLLAATYQRRRTGYGFSGSGAGSGIWRTVDGGDEWTRMTEGLPEGDLGRIGLDMYRHDGDLVYATVEGDRGEARGLYRSRDRGTSWEKVSDNNPRPMYFSMVRIDPGDPDRIYLGGVSLEVSDDGGRTWWERDGAEGIHVDHHALWIDPSDSDHVVLGTDGGIASTWDGAETWRHHDNLAIGQFYEIGVDMRDPYYVCGGLQDNSSWCAPSNSLTDYGVGNRDWYDVSGGDGFYNQIDPTDWRSVYTESQGGNISRYDPLTGEAQRIRPLARPQPGVEEGGEDEEREYDFNWNAPIAVSVHTPGTVYMGANHLMRSRDRGVTWEEASPDLTKGIDRDTLEIFGRPLSEPHLSRNDGISSYGTITTVDESPLDPDVVWVGTDDGNVQVTRDGGDTWTNVVDRIPDVPARTYVSRIDASAHEPGRAYVSFDGHRNDDYRPYVFVSDDFGRSWRRITTGLPDHSVNVVREHPSTPGLLFAGNEVGAWVSVDRGASWTRLDAAGFPTVPVDDMVVHPRDNDLVIGTHGRSAWIIQDVTPLEDIASGDVLASAVHLSEPGRATLWSRRGGWPFWGDDYFAEDPPDGALIRYWLRDGVGAETVADDVVEGDDGAGTDRAASSNGTDGPEEGSAGDPEADDATDGGGPPRAQEADAADEPGVTLTVLDASGATVRTLEAPGAAGLHSVVWDLRYDSPVDGEGDGDGGGGFGGAPPGPLVLPGRYTLRLDAAGESREVTVEVRVDPRVEATMAELRARQEATMSLHALAGPLTRARDRLDEISDRIDEVRELVRESDRAPEGLVARVDSLRDRVRDIDGELGRHGGAARLGRTLESVFAPPTADQLWQMEEAWAAVPGLVEQVNEVITRDLPALYDELDREGIRPVPPEPVEVPRRPGAPGGGGPEGGLDG